MAATPGAERPGPASSTLKVTSVPAATATSIASAIAFVPSAPSSAASAATRQTAALSWQPAVAPSAWTMATNSWAPYHRRHLGLHPSHNFPLYIQTTIIKL